MLLDSTPPDKKPCLKFVGGGDCFFLRYGKGFFSGRLKIAPLSGAFIVTDWKDIGNYCALACMPEIIYAATANTEISLTAVLFEGEGDNLFANMENYDMFMLKKKYMF